MTLLLVIRHAATDWNERSLIQGRADRPLSAAGRAWAADARLPAEWIGARCLSSPLVRAMETARLLGLEPVPEPRLIEMAWGDWEGRRLAALRTELGDEMAANEARGLDFRPPGGESPREVQKRLLPLLREISIPTVAVTHKGVLRALYALATGWAMQDKPPQKLTTGCAYSFEVDKGGRVSVARLNIRLECP
jgi:probable phosphoglycerate mutase